MFSSFQPEYIVYLFAVIFGILSISYFTRDILLSLSHTVKNIIMYFIAIFFFIISIFTGTITLSIIFIALSLCMYSYSIKYTWDNYNLNEIKRFSLLSISSVLLLIIGLLYQNNIIYNINNNILIIISVIMIIILGVLSLIDIRSKGIKYNFKKQNNINIKNSNTKIGELKIKNEGKFSRRVNKPKIKVYVNFDNINEEQIPYQIQNSRNSIKPNEEYSLDVSVRFEQLYKERSWGSEDNIEISEGVILECDKKEDSFEININKKSD